MKIKYEFLTGEIIEVSAPVKIAEEIIRLEKEEENSNRKETQHNLSLSEIKDGSNLLIDINVNVEEDFFKKSDSEKLHGAILRLKPKEQDLIHKLYFIDSGLSAVQCAGELGITENALRIRLSKIKKKLKNYILNR